MTGLDKNEGVETTREEDEVGWAVEGRGIELSEVEVGIEKEGEGCTIDGPGEKRGIEGTGEVGGIEGLEGTDVGRTIGVPVEKGEGIEGPGEKGGI